jgi:very-short-patch-repair endonuclease
MLRYRKNLKPIARKLRKDMTESENVLWDRLRRKQLLGVQFCRQRPIGNYIADFIAPKAKLVIEVDGSQHMSGPVLIKDRERDEYLGKQGILVLRFSDSEILKEIDAVLEVIFRRLSARITQKSPRSPL